MKIKLILIRHGRTCANEEGRYLGKTDEGLSEKGISEIKEKYPKRPEAEAVFVSPLKRCRETAEIIFGDIHQEIIEEFREMDFGDFEMMNYEELKGNVHYQTWIDGGGRGAFPNGESREAFIKRVMKGFNRLLKICTDRKIKNAAAVVHGGTVMALMSTLAKEDYFSFQVRNGEGYIITGDLKSNDISYDSISCGIRP